jgi:uncharacterized protein
MKKHLLFLLVFFSFALSFAQRGIPPVPKEQKPVYQINTTLLNQQEEQLLSQKLLRYSDSTSTQMVVLIMDKTNGDNHLRFGTDIAQKWGIGQKGKDNGILILITLEERKTSIITGKGIEYLLTDALSKRIIEQIIIPNFKQKQFYTAIDQASDRIFEILTGEYKNDKKGSGFEKGIPFLVIFLIVMVFLIISSRKGGSGKGGNRSFAGPSLTDMIILSSLGRSGGFGGSGGGGFSGGFGGGFGGGSFGGGGASGSW